MKKMTTIKTKKHFRRLIKEMIARMHVCKSCGYYSALDIEASKRIVEKEGRILSYSSQSEVCAQMIKLNHINKK